MTIIDAIDLPWKELRSLAIVMSRADADRLSAVASGTTTDALRVQPVPLVDGRLILPADLLTEADGRLSALWSLVAASGLAAAVDVVPMASVSHLLPAFPLGAA